MLNYNKIKIQCPCCNKEHKLIIYGQQDNIFECPATKNHFQAKGDSYQICTIDTEISKSISDGLLPLNNFLPKNCSNSTTNDDNIKTAKDSGSTIQKEDLENLVGIVGRYQLQEKIGEGGFGIVFKGYDPVLRRTLAIKASRYSIDKTNYESFRREAELLARLDHPNIINTYDFGLSDNQICYIISEFINGTNICSYMENLEKQDGERNFMTIGKCFRDLASALFEMHKNSIYHQDIKPDNILVSTETGIPKLCDFGLAKEGSVTFYKFFGSYEYAAPEKFEEQFKATAQSDIFSFGAVLYEILTGRKAFGGSNMGIIINNVINKEITFKKSDQVDSDLQKICLKCLMKNPQQRYLNAKDLLFDLMNYVSRKDVGNCPLLFFVCDAGPKNLIFSINDRYYSIGRALSNHLVITEKGVSRLHAVIYKDGSDFFLENLSKTSHTAINGKKVKNKIKLKANDIIEIADSKLKYVPNKNCLYSDEKPKSSPKKEDDVIIIDSPATFDIGDTKATPNPLLTRQKNKRKSK
ncbi:FHA domain-containing serine/threonine-protein kinase [Candidatus Uabimicrobium helgolandensis]